MRIQDLRVLRGPNVWTARPVLELVLDVEDLSSDREVRSRLGQVAKDLLDGEACATDDLPLMLAHTLVAATRKLQQIAGSPAAFIAVQKTARARIVLAVVEFAEEALARAALEIAWRLLTSAANGPVQPTPEDVRRLKELMPWLPGTVLTTYEGAKKRGVPGVRLSPEYSRYLYLGQGSKQRRLHWSEPDSVNGVARVASVDKYLTKQLLESVGVPVPRGRLLYKVEEAWAAANEVGLPVAVKPYDSDLQKGVSLDLQTREQVETAFKAAIALSDWVLVEHFAPGVEHRVLVVDERVVAVARIDPPQVVGDGVSTIAQLVEKLNQDPRRNGDDPPLGKLKLDDVALSVLASQGYTLDSTLPAGVAALVRRNPPYIVNGGALSDLTDQIHPTTAAHAVAAAQMMQIPVAGLDVVAVDISKPLEEQQGVIVEINVGPGLWLHLAPWADSPRPVGDAIAAHLFPAGDGRIPVVALAGDEDRAIRRRLTTLLTSGGYRVGSASPEEMSSGDRRWPAPAGTPQNRAYVLFRNPIVDVALFETSGDELLQHGFATDRCDVAVVLGTVPAATGEERDPAEFVKALTNALSPEGNFVVTSDWGPARLGVAPSRVILVAGPEDADALKAHLDAGGRAVFVRDSDVVLGDLGDGKQPALLLGPAPASFRARDVRHVLAAVAAAWSLGVGVVKTAAYLRSLS